MSGPGDRPFLERATYRARRVQDAARMLPVVGAVLFALPLMWASGRAGSTAQSGLYLFAAWAGLVAAAFLLARLLARGQRDGDASGSED